MKILRIVFFFSLITLISCSTFEKSSSNEKNENIKKDAVQNSLDLAQKSISCWINKMPGSENKFHLSGEVVVNEEESLELKYVKVIQDNSEIYFIKPKVVISQSVEGTRFQFSTLRGMSINRELNQKKSVNLILLFNDDGDEILHQINDIEIQEVQ